MDTPALEVIRRELDNIRASHAALAEVLGPLIVPEAATALSKLREAADDLLDVVRQS